jgi:hypothetical protein
MAWVFSAGVFNTDGDRAGPIKHRNLVDHFAKQNNPWLRHIAVSVVNHEVIGTPET